MKMAVQKRINDDPGLLECRLRELEEKVQEAGIVLKIKEVELEVLRGKLQNLMQLNGQLNAEIVALRNSTSWKLTLPLRWGRRLYQARSNIFSRKSWPKFQAFLKTRRFRSFLLDLIRPEMAPMAPTLTSEEIYQQWITRYDTMTEQDRQAICRRIAALPCRPLISVAMPVYNTEERWLRAAIDSILNQLYPHWELCIADDASTDPKMRAILEEYAGRDSRVKVVYREQNGHISEASNSALALAGGEFVALFDHDDVLAEHALYMVAEEINAYPDADLIYTDEDKIDERNQRHMPYFKTDWNPDLFYCQNYFSHLGIFRTSLLRKIGGFRKGFEGSQDYDLVLRALKETAEHGIRHIPHVLYHWRAHETSTASDVQVKHYATTALRRAANEYLTERYPGITLSNSAHPSYHRLCWPLPSPEPRVTLIIPTRNKANLLKTCIDSIVSKTEYGNYRIVIVNNQSNEEETLHYFKHVKKDPRISVWDYNAPFNFAAINNFAVARAGDSPVIGFINNDIEIMTPEWLQEMVSQAMRPEVGAVGAKLYYPSGKVQHAGVLLGIGAPARQQTVAGHMFHMMDGFHYGYFARAVLTQCLSAVTGAMMIMRREVFEEVGGFNEKFLPVAYNDIDLCLKIREKGYRIIWTPYAEATHHESASRGLEDTPEKAARYRNEVTYMRYKWGHILDLDPFYNPNLDFQYGNFQPCFPPLIGKPWK